MMPGAGAPSARLTTPSTTSGSPFSATGAMRASAPNSAGSPSKTSSQPSHGPPSTGSTAAQMFGHDETIRSTAHVPYFTSTSLSAVERQRHERRAGYRIEAVGRNV